MRIVHLIARLNDGGPVRVLAGLCAALRDRGHDVEVWCGSCAADEPDASHLVGGRGIRVVTVPELGRGLGVGDAVAFAWLLREAARQRPQILHTHTAKAGALGRIVARLLRIPCVHTYHGHVLTGYFPAAVEALLRGTERLLGLGCHHHAPTPALVRELRGYGIGRRGAWHALPVPVEPVAVRRQPHAGPPVVLFLGRFAPVKDPQLWVEAVTALHRRRPVAALLAGDGPLRHVIEQALAAAGIPTRSLGFVAAGEALAGADVLLMTSRNEGQPLVVIEAAGAGVPVVAPAVGGLVDLARFGLVGVASRNPEALASAVEAALDRPRPPPHPLALALAPARLVAAYERMYRQVLDAR